MKEEEEVGPWELLIKFKPLKDEGGKGMKRRKEGKEEGGRKGKMIKLHMLPLHWGALEMKAMCSSTVKTMQHTFSDLEHEGAEAGFFPRGTELRLRVHQLVKIWSIHPIQHSFLFSDPI